MQRLDSSRYDAPVLKKHWLPKPYCTAQEFRTGGFCA